MWPTTGRPWARTSACPSRAPCGAPIRSTAATAPAWRCTPPRPRGQGSASSGRLREQLFLEGRNIARAEVLHEAARHAGLDADQLLAQVEDPHSEGWARFKDDLRLARTLGVTGFPTFVFRAGSAMRAITGVRPWHELAAVVDVLAAGDAGAAFGAIPGAPATAGGSAPAATSVDALLAHHDSWTAPEAAVFLDLPRDTTTRLLDDAVGTGRLARHDTRAGTLWRRR